MSTRSDIIVHRADGKWHRIYCHSDGYLEHNGKLLFDHYTSQERVEKLVYLGNLSCLGSELGRKWSFDRNIKDAVYREKHRNWCLSYLRDRPLGGWHFAKTQEEFVASERGEIGDSLFEVWPEQDTWTEFTYVWADIEIGEKPRDPCWWVGDPDKGTQDLVNLGDALQGKITIKPAVKAFGMVLGQHEALDPKNPNHGWKSIR